MKKQPNFDHILTKDEIEELGEQARQEYYRWILDWRVRQSRIKEDEMTKKKDAEAEENLEDRTSPYRRR